MKISKSLLGDIAVCKLAAGECFQAGNDLLIKTTKTEGITIVAVNLLSGDTHTFAEQHKVKHLPNAVVLTNATNF